MIRLASPVGLTCSAKGNRVALLTYQHVLKLLDPEEDLAENSFQEAVLIVQIQDMLKQHGTEWVKAHRKQLIARFEHTKSKMY